MTMRNIKTVWFDLDATLYSPESGLWAEIGNRIESYMQDILGFPRDQMLQLKLDYYLKYGTTLRGLQIHDGIHAGRYLDYVHDIAVQQYLQPDPELRLMLLRLPTRRWIFTNSDLPHTQRVLNALGIQDCFHGFITVERIQFMNKPNPEAYHAALQLCGEDRFENILFLDDSTRNLETAKALGVQTVLVGSASPHPAAHFSIRKPHELESRMPELFQAL